VRFVLPLFSFLCNAFLSLFVVFLLTIVLSVLRFTHSDYPRWYLLIILVGIFWPLYCLSFDLRSDYPLWYLLITLFGIFWLPSLVSSDYPLLVFSDYPLWYLQTFLTNKTSKLQTFKI
jgi:hypothetical protein